MRSKDFQFYYISITTTYTSFSWCFIILIITTRTHFRLFSTTCFYPLCLVVRFSINISHMMFTRIAAPSTASMVAPVTATVMTISSPVMSSTVTTSAITTSTTTPWTTYILALIYPICFIELYKYWKKKYDY